MNILITGSSGVIANEVYYELRKNKKYKFFLLSNDKIKNQRKKAKFIYHDLTKPIKFKLNIDVIIHCAAKHPFSSSGNDMKTIYRTNNTIDRNLIKFSNLNNIKKVIFLSTIHVYGKINKTTIAEDHLPNCPTLYGKSKFASERLFLDKRNSFSTTCLRLPGVMSYDLSQINPLMLRVAKKFIQHKDVVAYSLDKKFNNIITSYDIAKFINFILKRKEKDNNFYNFSASKPIEFIKVLNCMRKLLNSKSKIINNNEKNIAFTISNIKLKQNLNFQNPSTEIIIKRCCGEIKKKIKILPKKTIKFLK